MGVGSSPTLHPQWDEGMQTKECRAALRIKAKLQEISKHWLCEHEGNLWIEEKVPLIAFCLGPKTAHPPTLIAMGFQLQQEFPSILFTGH